MTDEHRSPLADWHEARGAEVLIEDGWPWYMHEGTDPMAEYEAIRTGTGIWDLFSTCKYEVTGPDAEQPHPAPVHESTSNRCRPVPSATVRSSMPTGPWSTTATSTGSRRSGSGS